MKRVVVLALSFLFTFQLALRADEGMWLPILLEQLNIAEMQEMGCELTADQIYSINNASLKDAIVALDYGNCTGELISDKGLILTNHHCGYGEIQAHSSVDHDYLADGFWAMSLEEELPNPGKTASFLVRIENVSDQIIPFLNDSLSETERYAKVAELSTGIIDKAIDGTHYEGQVKAMFNHNAYYLFVLETFRDVRLVGAPPSSIGKFGGDVDNWMWPRHTGDFSMFRVYSGPDGKPADYSPENIPFKPKHHLPVSLEGYEEGDFAMILGYPGSTDRYLSSFGIEETIEISNPNRIKIRGLKQSIWGEDMGTDDKIRIAYASKYSRSANYWKYSIGQNKGLKRLKIYDKKKATEDRLVAWMNEDQSRKDKYGEAIPLIENAYKNRRKYRHAYQYMYETMLGGTEIISFVNAALPFYNLLTENPDSLELINNAMTNLIMSADDYFKNYSAKTDQKVLAALLDLYHKDVDKEFHISLWPTITKKYKGDINKYAASVFAKTNFANKDKFVALVSSKNLKAFEKDPAFQLMNSVIMQYVIVQQAYFAINEDLNKGNRLFMAGLLEMDNDVAYAPNANSSMRVTYGKVGDYKARDAVHYSYQTTTNGILEKYDPDDKANFFNSPEKFLDIIKNKDFGPYSEGDMMPVAFTTNNDITGGNSGSPVINGKGHLIGVAFDGNWEAMSGDIAFEHQLQKCINVDIRYVLLVIDKYAGAQNLIDELTIIEKSEEPVEAAVEEPVLEEVTE
jgi:Peptidase S46